LKIAGPVSATFSLSKAENPVAARPIAYLDPLTYPSYTINKDM
jgi:hypothetical protein